MHGTFRAVAETIRFRVPWKLEGLIRGGFGLRRAVPFVFVGTAVCACTATGHAQSAGPQAAQQARRTCKRCNRGSAISRRKSRS